MSKASEDDEKPETTMIRVSVPTDLHSAVRSAGALRRKRWPRIIEEALTAWLAKNGSQALMASTAKR